MEDQFESLRSDFTKGGLLKNNLNHNPFNQTEKWLNEAIESKLPEPNAMSLATAGPSGVPHSRIVLLKDINSKGFIFYTNYESDKGLEMASCPNVAALFFWPLLERQVRIEGVVEKLPAGVSDLYFASRPRASQLGAWTSAQSRVVQDYDFLERAYSSVSKKFEGQAIPRPPYWGGYIIKPRQFEFWQGRPGRLHQRYRFSIAGDTWHIETLAP